MNQTRVGESFQPASFYSHNLIVSVLKKLSTPIAKILGFLVLLLFSTSAHLQAQNVGIIVDPAFVGSSAGTCADEYVQTVATYQEQGYSVTQIMSVSDAVLIPALAGIDVLVFAESEGGNPVLSMTPAAIAAIQSFTSSGGGVIHHGHHSLSTSAEMNPLFGLSLSDGSTSSSGSSSLNAVMASGTAFAGGPAVIPNNDGTAVLISTLPAGSKCIYERTATETTVAVIPYGGGQIAFLGWDWWQGGPGCSQDGTAWESVLANAVAQVAADTEPPVVTCTEFTMTFNDCPDAIFPNTPSGDWFPVPASGSFPTAVGGSRITIIDLNGCVTDNISTFANGDFEWELVSSYEENRIPGCSVDIINEIGIRDAAENEAATTIIVRSTLRDDEAPVVTCTDFTSTQPGCPTGLGPNTPNGTWIPIGIDGGFTAASGGSFSIPVDLTSCVTDNCSNLTDMEYTLFSSYEENRTTCSVTLVNEFSIRDVCGNIAANRVITKITIEDDTPPIFTTVPGSLDQTIDITSQDACPDGVLGFTCYFQSSAITPISVDVVLDGTFLGNFQGPNAADFSDCNLDNIICELGTPISSACQLIRDIRWIGIDGCGNRSLPFVQTLTINESAPPVVACTEFSENFNRCPDPLGPNTPSGNWQPVPASGLLSTAVGGSSIGTIDLNCVSDFCSTVGELEVRLTRSFEENRVPGCSVDILNEYEVRDACGNVSPDLILFRGQIRFDGPPPVLVTPIAFPLECGMSSAPAITGMATATSGCGTPVVTFSDQSAPGPCGLAEIITRTWLATDGCGKTSDATQLIVITDNTPPVITCPADVTIECTASTSIASNGIATATDDCGTIAITSNDLIVPGSCPGNFMIMRTFIATDECNNSATCTQTITVEDTEAPIFDFVPAAVTLECDQPFDVATLGNATAFDECENSLSTAFVTTTFASNNNFAGNMFDVTNVSANPTTISSFEGNILGAAGLPCSFQIYSRPGSYVGFENSAAGWTSLGTASSTTAGSGNPTPVPIGGLTIQPGQTVGIYFVLSSFTNGPGLQNLGYTNGNNSYVNATLRIDAGIGKDDVGFNGVTFSPRTWNGTINYTVPPPPIVVTSMDDIVAGACPQERTVTRTFTATDFCNNTSTATQVITIEDNTPPVITCPANVTIECTASTSIASNGTATAIDACGSSAITSTDVVTPGSCPGNFTITRTFVATDDCNNSTSCAQIITVEDTEGPIFDFVPAAITLECDQPFDVATLGNATAFDECENSLSTAFVTTTFANNNRFAGNMFNVTNVSANPTTILNFESNIDDLAGLPCSFEIYSRVGSYVGFENSSAGWTSMGTATGTTAGTGNPTLVEIGGLTIQPGQTVGIYFILSSYGGSGGQGLAYTNGNNSYVNATLQIEAGIAKANPDFTGSTFLARTWNGTINYSIPPPALMVTSTDDIVVGTCPQERTITRTFLATDFCNNSSTATQVINLIDTQAPFYTSFPRDTTVECSTLAGMNNIAVNVKSVVDAQGFPTVEDNCAIGLTTPFTDVFTTSMTCPTVSIYQRIFDPIDDGCGNILPSRTLTITVIDTLDPIFTSIPIGGDFDCTVGIPPVGTATAVDCDPNVVVTEVDDVTIVGVNQVVSITERTITARDFCGNETVQVETYRVLDQDGPFLLSCPDDLGPIVARPDDRVVVNYATPVFDDNCSFSVSSTHNSGQEFPVGFTQVVYTAVDGGGNVTICEFTIEVVKALNLTCLDQDISIDNPSDLTRSDINFPYASTDCDACPQGEPLPSLDYLGYFRGHRYYTSIPGDTRSWTEAQRYAVSLGGRLAEINSLEENRFLQRESPHYDALIGHYTGPRTTTWTGTFSPVIYENWATGFPTVGTNEFFALLNSVTGMHSNANHSEMPYIIEFPCVEMEVIDMPSDSLFDQGTNCVVYTAVDLCGNRDTCHYTFGVNTFDVNYCVPTGNEVAQEEDYYLTGVTMGAFAKTLDANDFYLQLRDTVELVEDDATAITLNAETSGIEGSTFAAYWRVWVDANKDGDFYDNGEMIYEAWGNAAHNGSFMLPSSLGSVSPTRIRIAFSRFNYPEPCGDNPFGAIVDFTLKSNSTTLPRLALAGTRGIGMHTLTTSSVEDPQIDRYMMLRGASPDDLTKIDFWDAAFGNNQRHEYNIEDLDPMPSAYYQTVALDDRGFLIRSSNIIQLTMPTRRDPVRIFPNPAVHQVYVDFGHIDDDTPINPNDGKGNIILFDPLGRMIQTQSFELGVKRIGVQLPTLATGTYMLRVTRPNKQAKNVRLMIDQSGETKIPGA